MLSVCLQHDESVRTPSFGRIRFYFLFDRNSKPNEQWDQQVTDTFWAAMFLADQFRERFRFPVTIPVSPD
jgi:hypothetical protein